MMEFVYFPACRYAGDEAKPTLQQRRIEHRAVFIAGVLRALMSKLTIGQQMAMLETIRTWGVYVNARSASEVRRPMLANPAQTGAENGSYRGHNLVPTSGDY